MLLVRGTRGDCVYTLGNQVEANLVTIVDILGAKEGGADEEGKLGERGRGDVIGRGGCELWDEEGEG